MKTDKRPNILLLMTDQHRADCLDIAGHPVLQTPCLDDLARSGFNFTKAYSACPICVPARRTLMTGKKAATHGVMINYHTRLDGPTLPGELSKAGYQTHLVGKKHLWPERKLYGFDSMDWSDTSMAGKGDNDYQRYLLQNGINIPRASSAHGVGSSSPVARPWHLDEKLHFTNWCADKAIEFLERRDPTLPFFLKVSFIHPHQPCTPPQSYWDRYINMDLPDPVVGDWAKIYDTPEKGWNINPWRWSGEKQITKQFRAGYYGCINHIDDQIARIREAVPKNTIIVFTSDHGEMLGDHQWIRKRNAFEASAKIPLIFNFPEEMNIEQGKDLETLSELMDIMPTLLETAEVSIPECVEGKSLLSAMKGNSKEVRDYLHGECSKIPSLNSGMQFLTDGKKKYIYYPGSGEEHYFDLQKDPQELYNLSEDKKYSEEISKWREILVKELTGRPEQFTDGKTLNILGKETAFFMPGFERSNQ
ncbi:MAG: arylsulfatase [Planctomycetota bacterium]